MKDLNFTISASENAEKNFSQEKLLKKPTTLK